MGFWSKYQLFAAVLLLCGTSAASVTSKAAGDLARSGPNPYDAELSQLRSQFASTNAPRQSVLLRQVFSLRDYVDDPQSVAAFLREVASGPYHPLVRDEAQWRLATVDIEAHHPQQAAEHLAQLGFLSRWLVLPPAASDSGLSAPAPRGKLEWRALPQAGPYAWVDAGEFANSVSSAVAYVATAVHVATSTPAALRLGSGPAVAVFINGQQVFADASEGVAEFDQQSFGVLLQPGWSTITVKLARATEGSWRFALRLTAPDGSSLKFECSADKASTDLTDYLPVARPQDAAVIADLLAMAQAAAAADGGSGQKLATLAEIEHVRGRDGYVDHLEAAVRIAPAPQHWLLLARDCGDSQCTFAALKAAQAADRNNPQVLKALADYYFGRGQLEKARDLLEAAVQASPGDFVARKRLADLYASAGATDEALRYYRELETEFPAPLWLKRELALRYEDLNLYEDAVRLARSAISQDFDDDQARACLQRIYSRQGDAASLATVIAQARELHPADAQLAAEFARVASGTGDSATAIAALNSALEWHREDASLHRQLAHVLESAGQTAEAQRQLALANQLGPANDATQAAATADAADDSAYLVQPEKIAALAFQNPPAEQADAVVLADITIERVAANGLSTAHNQQIYYIGSDHGARDFATRSVQYSNAMQRLEIVSGRVYKHDGRVLDANDAGENGVADTSISMYYDSRTRTLRYPAVEKGDVVELEYRLSPAGKANPYGDYFGDLVTFRSSLPQKLRRYVLVAPASRKLNVYTQRMPAAAVREASGERVYRWDVRDTAALPGEPRGPAMTDVAPYVSVSTFRSWDELGRWYASLIAPQFSLDANLREIVNTLTRDRQTEADKIRAIHEFVLRNTHYVALEFGVYSYKPYPVTQVYARRFGDCKDKAGLMIAMLRAAGIEAQIALVRTRKMGDVGDGATTISIFNHAVVYIPKYDLWLDGTAEYAGSRELPLDDQGAMALTVALDGSARMRRIPVSLPLENYTHRTVRAELQLNGTIQFSGSAYTRGEDAPGLRREYEVRERQADSVRNNLAQVYSGVRVQSVTVEGAHDLETDINVRFRGSLDSFAGHKVFSLAPSWMPHAYLQALAPLTSREEDLLLPAPWTTDEELHFLLPDGGSFVALPAPTALQTPFGSAVIRYERRGRELTVITSVQFRKLRIMPAEYGAFREFCNDVERAFRNEIKVRLPG